MDATRLASFMRQCPIRILERTDGKPADRFTTGPVRLAFEHINVPEELKHTKGPKKGQPIIDDTTGKPLVKYNSCLIFPPAADLSVIMGFILQTATTAFGARAQLVLTAANSKGQITGNPLKLQNSKRRMATDGTYTGELYDGFASTGHFVNASSKFAPAVVDGRKTPLAIGPGQRHVYSGAWFNATCNLYTYDTDGNAGVSVGLVALQKLADDDEFKSAGDNTSGFGEITDDSAANVPAAAAAAAVSPADAAAKLAALFG